MVTRVQEVHTQIHKVGNIVGLLILSALMTVGFYIQLAQSQLPCPLCLLQRVMFMAVGVCMIFNLKQGIKSSHYGLMLLAALLGFAIAARHVLLHILPNDPGFGPPLWGLHVYTWSAIIFAIILIIGCGALLFDQGFQSVTIGRVGQSAIYLFLSLIALNALSSLLECGLGQCPDNPIRYLLLS